MDTITDPAELLDHARALEPALRLTERGAVLDRLETVLDRGPVAAAPAGRHWRAELLAERAIDATSLVHLDTAAELIEAALRSAGGPAEPATTRALMARARMLAWTGTERATADADALYVEVAERWRALDEREWFGQTVFWRAHTVFFQNGDLGRARALMHEALDILGDLSPRRPTVLTFYSDVLVALGEWDEASQVLAQARTLADRHDDPKARAYAAWSLAHIASAQGDALLTERHLREVERDGGDWLEMDTGVTFLAEAAEMLDRVGLIEAAHAYLSRAQARDPADEIVRQAGATLLARSGDPLEGIEALERLAAGEWLEKRLIWRDRLLIAWATFRAARAGAGELAARALEHAAAAGGLRVAEAGEPDLVAALAPLAEQAGSELARQSLLRGRSWLVRLFGTPTVSRDDGAPVPLPAGRAGELVRMLALHEHGLPLDMVLEAFFPEAPASRGRHRLRQLLLRIRAVAPGLVQRDGDHLRLAPAWVDVRAFLAATDRMRSHRGARRVRLAYTALALHGGPLLPTDVYAPWADATREEVDRRRSDILELIAADASARASHQEERTARDELRRSGAG